MHLLNPSPLTQGSQNVLSIDHSLHILAVAGGLEVRGLESPFGSTSKKLCDLELVHLTSLSCREQ